MSCGPPHPQIAVKLALLATALLSCERPKHQAAPHPKPTSSHHSAPVEASTGDFATLVERAQPGVINIYTRATARRDEDDTRTTPGPERVSLGSGFIIEAGGLAVTNYHVIRHATEIDVVLADQRRVAARVVGEDRRTDLALLALESEEPLSALPLGDSDTLRIGEWVIAIGNPMGLSSTVTAGIVSATGRRDVRARGAMMYRDLIQTDASINPGSSGGPLLNARGEVIGVNTAIKEDIAGIGFAVPISRVKQIVERLRADGKVMRSWIGIYVEDAPDDQRRALGGGASVLQVVEGGPAQRAGLRPGDIITHWERELLPDAAKLSWLAGHSTIGATITLSVRRDAQALEVPITLGALPR